MYSIHCIRDNGLDVFITEVGTLTEAEIVADDHYDSTGFEYVVVRGEGFNYDEIIYSTYGITYSTTGEDYS